MAQVTDLDQAIHRIAAELTEFARSRGWNPDDYRILARTDRKWRKIHLLFDSKHFDGRDNFECYREVIRFLKDRLQDDPDLSNTVSLVVRSEAQVQKGSIYELGSEYQKVNL